MTEFNIEIKNLNTSFYLNDEGCPCDIFLDDFIDIIESLGLQFGGSSDYNTGRHRGVIDFGTADSAIIEGKMYHLQKWVLDYPIQSIILLLDEYVCTEK